MTTLIIGLALFLGIHSISIFALGLRNKLAQKSDNGWKAFYSIISLAGLALIVLGYSQARQEPQFLFSLPVWVRHISATLMLPFFILFFAPYLPGKISQLIKHPQLTAVILWALSHILVNGNLADVVLFGSFLLWAMTDRLSMNNRASRPISTLPKTGLNDVVLVVSGLGFYVGFVLYFHQWLIGIPLISH